jgi:NADPH:quinone reductase-like Zn-dependent oxidoreductase
MQAIVQDKYGSADVLELREIEQPKIGELDVLLHVRAAGVNPADWAIMNGLPYIARPAPLYGLRRPNNPVRGTDVAGVVEAIGSSVTRFRPGDEVFGWSRGSFADFAAASEDKLALKPANITFEQAAAVPMAGLVALQAIRDHGQVQSGTKVLIDGASGGIGTFAVQIAKALGADVTGVCSTQNLEMVRSIGADHVIDYTREDFTRNGQRYDVILDNAGKQSLTALRRSLAPTGTLIPNAGGFDNRWLASAGRLVRAVALFRFGRQRLGRFLVSPRQVDLEALKGLIEAGKVTPVIDRSYPLSETRQAMARVGGQPRGAGHARGKIAITVSAATASAVATESTQKAPMAAPAAA